ncbi:hypothetical protein SAMN06309944_1834 [Micrococcales bacterium KH10]|nr:hypothetical protein SAMN06309944_1834 [Micrococcales bacterium KH10]
MRVRRVGNNLAGQNANVNTAVNYCSSGGMSQVDRVGMES